MATVLDKQLKREVSVDGVAYTVALDPEGIRLTGKGKRRPEVDLHWRDLLSGDAAMAVALNASLAQRHAPPKSATAKTVPAKTAPAKTATPTPADRTSKPGSRKPPG